MLIDFLELQKLQDLCKKKNYKGHLSVTGFFWNMAASFDCNKTGNEFLISKKLTVMKNISSVTLRKYLSILEENGWIECTLRTRRVDCNQYRILWSNFKNDVLTQ